MKRIQLIPNLVQLDTDSSNIPCFSFFDNKKYLDFFEPCESSPVKIAYRDSVANIEPIASVGKPSLQFSHLSYYDDRRLWVYNNKRFGIDLKFTIDEAGHVIRSNYAYHNIFIRVGYLEPLGYVITDYLTYQMEKLNIYYVDGAAAHLGGKTIVFFGFGKNFKTTITDSIIGLGGKYIGEEFIVIKDDEVFATIPNSHHFDFRPIHKKILRQDLKGNKIDRSKIDLILFLILSDQDKVIELDADQANELVKIYWHTGNTYYYNFFKSRDILLSNTGHSKDLFNSSGAKYYQIYFTRPESVLRIIEDHVG